MAPRELPDLWPTLALWAVLFVLPWAAPLLGAGAIVALQTLLTRGLPTP